MQPIVWEDPPELGFFGTNTAAGKWVRILSPLMQHPEKWARVYVYGKSDQARNAVSHLRRRQRQIPDGRWEFTSRKLTEPTDEGQFAVYARYMGA